MNELQNMFKSRMMIR